MFARLLMSKIMAREWRMPALVIAVAFLAGWLMILIFEPSGSDIKQPLNYVWFFFISGTTVGYGDLSPETTGGRIGAIMIIVSGLSAGLVLFAQLTLWIAKGKTLKVTGHGKLQHSRHLAIIGYDRNHVRQILRHFRADAKFAKVPAVVVFWEEQFSGENPDPGLYDIVLFDETAFERACLEKAAWIYVNGRTDDETVRVLLHVNAYFARRKRPVPHCVAGVIDNHKADETRQALQIVNSDIEFVGTDDPVVLADVLSNPGVGAIYTNLASNLDSDASLFRIDIPEGAGPWPRMELAIHLLGKGCTLLAVGESNRPNARFRMSAKPDDVVGGGQSLAVVAKERPEIAWETVPSMTQAV